jgi:D-aminopeptidase
MRSLGVLFLALLSAAPAEEARPRLRDLGVRPGIFEPGPLNAVTDVEGVRVGHRTIVRGEAVRTGVTAILAHGGDLFRDKVPGAVYVGNGFGKAAGFLQVAELGTIETPIVLTNTLSVGRAVEAVVAWTLARPGNEEVGSVNAVVGETNDGWLSDIRGFHVTREDVWAAIDGAGGGPVEEGSVGAVLTIDGVRVGEALGRFSFSDDLDGSCMVVLATDAPVLSRNLGRMARRAVLGLARTGSFMANGSGDFVIAFSTRNRAGEGPLVQVEVLDNEAMSPLFLATVEAVEEAVYNSLTRASTVAGRDGHVAEAIPIERLRELLRASGRIAGE